MYVKWNDMECFHQTACIQIAKIPTEINMLKLALIAHNIEFFFVHLHITLLTASKCQVYIYQFIVRKDCMIFRKKYFSHVNIIF